MNTFNAVEALRAGWDTFKKEPLFFVGVAVIIGVISWIVGSIGGDSQRQSILLPIIGILVSLFVQTLLDMGVTSVALKAQDNTDTLTFRDLWHPYPFWSFLAASLLGGIIVMFGIMLLIVPGIILALMLFFTKYIVIDRQVGPIVAIRESARLTKGHKWQLLLLVLLIIAINALGILALFVGLLVSIPVTILTIAHAYRTLEHAAGEITITA